MKKLTLAIIRGDFQSTQFTVDMQKFTPGEHFVKSVVEASTIDKMDDDVREYGKNADLW
jgi:hypothetical protein